jgi:hypothetical protein
MCDWESLTTSCKSGDRFDGGVWALHTLPTLQHIQPMAAQARATFMVAFRLISFLLFIIVLQFLSFLFLIGSLRFFCGLIGLYFLIREILQDIRKANGHDKLDSSPALLEWPNGW